jgi:hypothetical protein
VLPIDWMMMMMLQGLRAEQLRAAAAAFELTSESRALCRLAGNAIPAEFCLVVVRGLALCYPELTEALSGHLGSDRGFAPVGEAGGDRRSK